jgi:hypothetical protein
MSIKNNNTLGVLRALAVKKCKIIYWEGYSNEREEFLRNVQPLMYLGLAAMKIFIQPGRFTNSS